MFNSLEGFGSPGIIITTMSAAGAIFGGMVDLAATTVNNQEAAIRAREDRAENYRYGEMAAENADKRTRTLYNDFYSPEALASQYKAAGLSPSLMFGGTPGQGGMSGAQGTGAAGIQTPIFGIDPLKGAQIANIVAQTQKTKAETANINKDTDLKRLDEQWNEMRNNEKSVDFTLTTTYLENKETGEKTSLYEYANKAYDYDQFLNMVRTSMKENNNDQMLKMTGTEAGQKTLRTIFMEANRFETEIAILSQEGVSAKFQENIINCLKQQGFAEQNAETVTKQLKAAGESADLTTEQKAAWNKIIDRLQRKNSTVADYIIVASMILNQAASHWSGMGATFVKQK